jgi:hypothetical protein
VPSREAPYRCRRDEEGKLGYHLCMVKPITGLNRTNVTTTTNLDVEGRTRRRAGGGLVWVRRSEDARPWSRPERAHRQYEWNAAVGWYWGDAKHRLRGDAAHHAGVPIGYLNRMPESVPATVGARQCGLLPPWASKTENTEIPDAATYQILTGSRRLPLPAPTSRLAAIAIARVCRAEDCDIRDI